MDLDFYLSHEQEGDRHAEAGRLSEASAAYAQALALNPRASWIATKQKRLGHKETARQHETAPKAINLFLPYYTPKDRDRADELRLCLAHLCVPDRARRVHRARPSQKRDETRVIQKQC